MKLHTPSTYHAEIIQMRVEGKRPAEIASKLGLSVHSVRGYIYRQNLPAARDIDALVNALTPQQAGRLQAFAAQWECSTAEAALEIIRDVLEEEVAREGAQ